MKFINENAPALGIFLLLIGMAAGATVWVATEINDVRSDLHETEMRLAEKINQNAAAIAENAAAIAENAAGIAETNERLARIEERLDKSDQRFEAMLEALVGHTHADDGSATFAKPTAAETLANPDGYSATQR